MEPVSPQDLDAITAIANRIPGKQGNELLALIASWNKCARAAPRQIYDEHVRFSSDNGKHAGKAKDLSTSGIFIEGSESFAVGEQVGIVLSAPSSAMPVTINGTVVRHSQNGIGIRFNYESTEDRDLIDALVSGQT